MKEDNRMTAKTMTALPENQGFHLLSIKKPHPKDTNCVYFQLVITHISYTEPTYQCSLCYPCLFGKIANHRTMLTCCLQRPQDSSDKKKIVLDVSINM